MQFDELFISKTLPTSVIIGTIPFNASFVIDSRVSCQNSIFVALAGKHCDGHDFILQACQNGAVGIMIAASKKNNCVPIMEKNGYGAIAIIIVDDPYTALIKLATVWRRSFSYPVIGITGSVGKTSTKELLALVCKKAGMSYVVSQGNQNTELGAALNILTMRDHHDIAIFEMGISKRGEMVRLAYLVRPTIAIITNIAHCHMEGLGSLQDIAQEKRKIFTYFTEHNISIVNGDQPLLGHVAYHHPIIKFGLKMTNQVQARRVRVINNTIQYLLKIYKEKQNVITPIPHISRVMSSLIVSCVAHVLNIPIRCLLDAIQEPLVIKGRFEVAVLGEKKGTIINDCYNANPESMKAALMSFAHIKSAQSKIVVLGDMLELGINSSFWHRQIGRFFKKVPDLKKMILVGNMVQYIERSLPLGVGVVRVNTWQEAVVTLDAYLAEHESLVLVKGSNGMGLINLVRHFTHDE